MSGFPRILLRFAATDCFFAMPQLSSLRPAARPAQNAGRASRIGRNGDWDESSEGAVDATFKRLSRQEAADLRAQEPPVSPWRVVAAQAAVGMVAALLGAVITGKAAVGWSMLYGAATVVLPAALMARGMTSKLSSMAPGASAVSFMLWEFVKIGVSLAMLVIQPDRAAVGVASLAGRTGGVHEGLLGGVVVAQSQDKFNERDKKSWQLKVKPRCRPQGMPLKALHTPAPAPVNTSFTT